jgi:hypothetical protein
MKITTNQLTQARDTLSSLLEEIGLENYVFEVEPKEKQWGVTIECEIDEGWERFELSASEDYITRGKDDAILHQFLLDEWGDALQACKKK